MQIRFLSLFHFHKIISNRFCDWIISTVTAARLLLDTAVLSLYRFLPCQRRQNKETNRIQFPFRFAKGREEQKIEPERIYFFKFKRPFGFDLNYIWKFITKITEGNGRWYAFGSMDSTINTVIVIKWREKCQQKNRKENGRKRKIKLAAVTAVKRGLFHEMSLLTDFWWEFNYYYRLLKPDAVIKLQTFLHLSTISITRK